MHYIRYDKVERLIRMIFDDGSGVIDDIACKYCPNHDVEGYECCTQTPEEAVKLFISNALKDELYDSQE